MRLHRSFVTAIAALATSVASAQIDIGTTDASDGVFAPAETVVVDLSLATTGTWTDASDGNGIYDPEQWAVVFKYESVNIPSGVTVTFANHPSGAPVIWLVQDSVVIDGIVNLDGQDYINCNGCFSEPGPGGFRGGRDYPSGGGDRSAGFGPGGGNQNVNTREDTNATGSYAGGPRPYGNAGVFPLIGGSGGGGGGYTGGAGGGAILIACRQSVEVNGQIRSEGGKGQYLTYNGPNAYGGAGGGIRLVASTLAGSGGIIQANGVGGGGFGGSVGRIRIEADDTTEFAVNVSPPPSFGLPGATPRLMRDPSTPWINLVAINADALPTDPVGEIDTIGGTDFLIPSAGESVVRIETMNVPSDWVVSIRVTRKNGAHYDVPATFDSEVGGISTWLATVNFGNGIAVMQARASAP